MKSLLSIVSLFVACAQLFADNVKVEQTVTANPPKVEERSYQENGSTITERVTTQQVKERVVTTPIPNQYKAAIFVASRLPAGHEEMMSQFEDFITGKITDLGFQVLSKEVVSDSLRKYDPALAGTARPANSLDSLLSEQSSALRLAQGFGADYLLVASLTSIGTKEKAVNAYGVNMVTQETTLRYTYKIIDGQTGSTITADSDKATYEARQTENAAEKNSDLVNELMANASEKIAASLGKKIAQGKITAPSAVANDVEITINIEAADIAIPDVRVQNNTVTIAGNNLHLVPLNASVEVNGVAVGSAPGKVSLKPGFSKLRVTREGFVTWERTINAVKGQVLTVTLQMTEQNHARWMANTAFLNELQNNAKLTDATVEQIKGMAQMLRQSGYKVDTKDAPATNIFLR